MPPIARKRPSPPQLGQPPIEVHDFSGGWNPRDAPDELEDNESPDQLNFTLDERGGIVKRLGLAKIVAGEQGAAAFLNGYYSRALGAQFAQQGANLYQLSAGAWALRATFSTADRLGFCDFQATGVAIHPVDGVFTSADGVTWTHAAGSPPGYAIVPWENKCWAIGDPGQPHRLKFSANGSVTDWAGIGSGNNDLRERDVTANMALGVPGGLDAQGVSGLLLAKGRSLYRINDPTDGAYEILDPDYGAAGPLAVASNLGRVAFMSERGIIATDGSTKPELVSSNLTPLFNDAALNMARLSAMCGGVKGDRIVFSLSRSGQASNDLTLEYHPDQKWVVPHGFGASWFTTFAQQAEKLYMGARARGFVCEAFTGGVDDDNQNAARPIACHYQGRWIRPGAYRTTGYSIGSVGAGGHQCQLVGAVVVGRGSYNLYVRTDYTSGQGQLYQVAAPADNVWTWDVDYWDDPSLVWGPSDFENVQRVPLRDRGRVFAFRIEQTGSGFRTSPSLLGDGAALQVGEVALYNVDADWVQLGLS